MLDVHDSSTPQKTEGLLGDLGQHPMMLMTLGAALMQAGQTGASQGALSHLIGAMQQAKAQQSRQAQAQNQAALRQAQLDFEKDKFSKMHAHRQAQLGLQHQQLGFSKQQLGLDQHKYQGYLKAVEGMKANLGVLGQADKGIAGRGLLGGQLNPQQFQALSALNFLQAGHPQGAVSMIQGAYPVSAKDSTTLQKNLQAAGLKPGTPEYQDAIQQSIMKHKGGSTQDQINKKLLEADIDKFKRYDKLSEEASRNMIKINQFKQAIDQFATGKFAPIKLAAGQLDQSLTGGLLSDKKEIGAGELIRTFGTEFMLQFIARTKGAISERENKLFMAASPGLDKTPEGNLRIANAMEAVNQRLIEKASFMRTYLQTHNTLSGAEAAWSHFVHDNPILDEDFRIHQNNISNWRGYLGGGRQAPETGSGGHRSPIPPQSASAPPKAPKDPLGIR